MYRWNQTLALTCICCLAVASAQAQNLQTDPTGSWRWGFDGNGNSVDSLLVLEADKEGKVSGKLVANGREIEVLDGKIADENLEFKVKFAMQSQEVTGAFQGNIDGDKVHGDIQFDAGGEKMHVPWKAERSVQAMDLVGGWMLVIDSPAGGRKSELTVTEEEDKLKIVINSQDGSETEMKDVIIKMNHLHYKFDLDYQGSVLAFKVQGRPYGSKIAGTMHYAFDGMTGKLTFTGVRKK